jgi:hypothetical protein
MRFYTLASLIALAAATPVAAEIVYSGTKSAVFTNPVGGTSNGAGTSWLNFGDNNHGSFRYYTGGDGFSVKEGNPFRLGWIGLWNGNPTNIPSQVTFEETLNFSQPGLGPVKFDFTVGMSKSGNNVSVTFAPGQTSTFISGNTAYTLELLGLTECPTFSTDNAKGTLTTPPCEDKTAYVWGKLDQLTVDPPPSVPEPSAIIMGAIGLGLIGVRRWRKATASGRIG